MDFHFKENRELLEVFEYRYYCYKQMTWIFTSQASDSMLRLHLGGEDAVLVAYCHVTHHCWAVWLKAHLLCLVRILWIHLDGKVRWFIVLDGFCQVRMTAVAFLIFLPVFIKHVQGLVWLTEMTVLGFISVDLILDLSCISWFSVMIFEVL